MKPTLPKFCELSMVSHSTHLTLLKLSIIAILAAWCCVWIIKPTQLWKKSWHKAEDWADATLLGESGLNVIVFCFPLWAVAVLGYFYHQLCAREGRIRKRTPIIANFSNPIIANSPIGTVSSWEAFVAVLFIIFLAWTYYLNIASDLKKMTPSKSVPLNQWQYKVLRTGVRFGSLSEACLVLLLVPVLRVMALLRICGIQFEASVRYHIWLGNGIMIFSVLHGMIIMCVWGSNNVFWREITRWQRTGRVNLAGAITLATGMLIWITSLPQLRRRNFQFFYLSHHLYVIFIIFFLLHGGAGHFYLVFPGVLLFTLDKILRLLQSRRTTCLVSARILPSKVVELTIPKKPCMQYTPLSILFVKIPSISKLQWHPFSITSSSKMEDDRLSIIIKCQGPWTDSLYNKLRSIEDTTSSDMKSLYVAVEGPYGPAYFPDQSYDSLVLIAGGSGITPFLSILQDVASRKGSMNNNCKNIELVYAVKKSFDLSMLTPISPLLLNHPTGLVHLRLRLFVTQEKEGSTTSIREILHDMSQAKNIILDRNLANDGVPEPEGFLSKSAVTGLASIIFLIAIVCLSHVFIPQRKRNAQNRNPSWISDILIICSFIIAISCGITVAAVMHMWKKSTTGYSQKNFGSRTNSEKAQDVFLQHDISYGQRPNLNDILLQQSSEGGEAKAIGVFVCGPASMQEAVASFCKQNSPKCGAKNKCFYIFHSTNFSL